MTEKEKRFAEIYGSKEGINQLVQGDEAERKRITDEFKRTYPGVERMARRRDNALKQMIQADNFMKQSPMTEEDAKELAKSMKEIRDTLVAQGVNAVLVPDYSYLELEVYARLARERDGAQEENIGESHKLCNEANIVYPIIQPRSGDVHEMEVHLLKNRKGEEMRYYLNNPSSDVSQNTVDDRKEGESESKRQVEDEKGAKRTLKNNIYHVSKESMSLRQSIPKRRITK